MRFARPLPATGAREHREVASMPPSGAVALVAFDVRCRAHAWFDAAGQGESHHRPARDHLCGRHRGRRHRSLRAAGRSPHGAPYSRQTYGDGAGDPGLAGGIRAANYLAEQAPRDGTAITTFANGPILEPL